MSLKIISANTSKINAEPFVKIAKIFGFGDFPITVNVVLKVNIHRNIPVKNIITMINRENRSGKLKSLKSIIVPADVHHR